MISILIFLFGFMAVLSALITCWNFRLMLCKHKKMKCIVETDTVKLYKCSTIGCQYSETEVI